MRKFSVNPATRGGDRESLVGGQVLLLLAPRRRQVVVREPDAVPGSGIQGFGNLADAVPGVAGNK